VDGYIDDWQTAARLILYAFLAVEFAGFAVCFFRAHAQGVRDHNNERVNNAS